MNYTIDNHPSEEILVETAINQGDDTVLQHILECEKCNEFVDEMRLISKDISEIEEEDIPLQLQNRILSITKKRLKPNPVFFFLYNWHKNPFLFGLITALAAIFSFVIFEFFL